MIVPEPTEQSPPPLSKRRQSSTSESGSKRARLSIGASHDGKDEHISAAATEDRRLERRKSGQVEERKRGQRLFGALIGTLSQSSSSTAQKRRADIEKKQQAKLRLQAEEFDEKRRKRLEDLMIIRHQEQKKFDKQSVRRLTQSSSKQHISKSMTDADSPLKSSGRGALFTYRDGASTGQQCKEP